MRATTAVVLVTLIVAACAPEEPAPSATVPSAPSPSPKPRVSDVAKTAREPTFGQRLATAALRQTQSSVTYDPAYVRLAYPGGDVPADRGVCADVVIRAYRALNVDLQVLVHQDMIGAFARYPQRWGMTRTDTNIDHRRVPNLETYFRRAGSSLAPSMTANDYQPGDLVSWIVAGSLPHIGIVSEHRSADGERPLMVHNIGAGPKLEDVLFAFPIVGHFRYAPASAAAGTRAITPR